MSNCVKTHCAQFVNWKVKVHTEAKALYCIFSDSYCIIIFVLLMHVFRLF